MASIRPLEQTLAENVDWNKARINFLAKFLVALIQVRSVNLTQIATVFPGQAKEESHYKRIQRFLRLFEISYAMIAVLIVSLMGVPGLLVLTLDRTNWQIGKTPMNVLVLAIVYKGVAIPEHVGRDFLYQAVAQRLRHCFRPGVDLQLVVDVSDVE